MEKKEAEVKKQEEDEEAMKDRIFNEKIQFSSDLTDQLQELVDYLKMRTSSTAVYVGKLVSPKRPISDEDDETAHIDEEAAKIIHFMHATQGHEYLVDKVLK